MDQIALLVIDVQNVMFGEEGVMNSNSVLENIYSIVNSARYMNVPVIYIQHTDHFLKEDAYIWEIDEKIKPADTDYIVRKSKWDSFYKTELLNLIKRLDIKKLIIMGMQTEFCVDTTLRNAYSLGLQENIVVSDAHTTFDTEVLTAEKIISHHNSIWNGRFANLMSTVEVIKLIKDTQ